MGGKSLARMKQEWYWKAKEEEAGKFQATREFNARAERKRPIQNRLVDWIEKKIAEIEPLDALAVGGLIMLIQPLVAQSEKLADYTKKYGAGASFAEIANILLKGPIGDLFGLPNIISTPPEGKLSTGEYLLSWVIALVTAIIIVKIAPRMLTGASSISNMISVDVIVGAIMTLA